MDASQGRIDILGTRCRKGRNFLRESDIRRGKCTRTRDASHERKGRQSNTDSLLRTVLSESGLGETCGQIGEGRNTTKVSKIAMRRTLP